MPNAHLCEVIIINENFLAIFKLLSVINYSKFKLVVTDLKVSYLTIQIDSYPSFIISLIYLFAVVPLGLHS